MRNSRPSTLAEARFYTVVLSTGASFYPMVIKAGTKQSEEIRFVDRSDSDTGAARMHAIDGSIQTAEPYKARMANPC